MRYEHTQRAPLCWLLAVPGAGMLAAALAAEMPQQMKALLAAVGALFLVLSTCFRSLTVRDEGDRLAVRFGPLPLFRRRVPYDNIVSVNRGRTTWIDGWGIHLSPRGGWTWNLWGFDCVTLQLRRGRKLNIGTDDGRRLAEFLDGTLKTEAAR